MSRVLDYLEGRTDIPEPTLSSLRSLAALDAQPAAPETERLIRSLCQRAGYGQKVADALVRAAIEAGDGS